MAGLKAGPLVVYQCQAVAYQRAMQKSKNASTGTQTAISPIPDSGKKGVGADTSHHRSNFLYNIGLGARIFIYIIFPKTKGTPANNLRHVNYFSGNSKQAPILLFQCILF